MNLNFADPTTLLLLALLLAWAGLLFGGFIFGTHWSDNTKRELASRRMPRWTRLASSLVLVMASWVWWLVARDGVVASYALAVAVGMTLGFVGDLFMAKLIIQSDKHVLGGIGAFGLGHIAYIVGFLGFGDALGATDGRIAAWLAWLIIGAAAWYVVVYRGQAHSVLHYAALPYALLLSSTAGVATGLAINLSAFVPLAVGCALFLLSDLILAARLFNGLVFRLIDDVIWLTYGPAQMLIVYSVGAALGVAG
jgi:hypothetical protein